MSKSDEYRDMASRAERLAEENSTAREHYKGCAKEWRDAAKREDRRRG